MLMNRLNSSAAPKLLPGGKGLLIELENRGTNIPHFPHDLPSLDGKLCILQYSLLHEAAIVT